MFPLLNRTYILLALAFLLVLLLLFRKRREIALVIRENRRISIFIAVLALVVASVLLFFVNSPGISLASKAEAIPSTSFTFFDVGENTLLTKNLLGKLDKTLGQHRLENITPVSMEFIATDWISSHFPEFTELNALFAQKRLVKPIASKTLKLDYRYAAQHAPPFTNVHFIFSDYSKKSLFTRMRMEGNGEETLTSLKTRYGAPQSLEEKKALSPPLFWRNQKDLLIFAVLPDRYGKAETSIFIIYGDNLELFRKDLLEEYPEPATTTGLGSSSE